MTPQHFSVFLLSYFLMAAVITTIALLRDFRKGINVLLAIVALGGLILSTVMGSLLFEGENFLFGVFERLSSLSRLDLLAFGFGASCALPLALHIGLRSPQKPLYVSYLLVLAGVLGTFLFAGLSAGKDLISPYLPNPSTELKTDDFGKLSKDDYVLEDFIETNIIPVRIDVSPSGKIYVSGHIGIAAQEGGIVELTQEESGKVTERRVAEMLNRPYGLVAEDDYLLVSRSGQYSRWNKGVVEQISTGAVTLLKDLDGDGIMDYYDDVVSGLPGAKGPDFLHQNNGIALDSDGSLFITTANHTDGYPVDDPKAGAILKASGENFENVEVFASGLRNPFGLEFTAEGELFATDNDAQAGVLGGNMGDKLLHIQEGSFYGHPFGVEGDEGVGDTALRSKFALGGLTFADSDRLPEAYRNHLFAVVYGEGRIMQIQLSKEEGQTRAKLLPFAVVPGAVDVAAAPNGDFYVAVYPNKIVRMRLKTSAASS